MLSVHDALEAWQAGEITAGHAMQMTGAVDVMELYAFAQQSDVAIRSEPLPREREQAARATELIGRLLRSEAAQMERRAAQGAPVK